VNKPSPPTEARLLDAQAMQTLKEVATEFAVFKSAAGGKADSKSDPASMLTSMVAEAGRPQADVARTDKAQQRADAFAAHIVWLSEAPLLPGRAYLLKAAGQTVGAMVTELKYRLDDGTLEHLAAKELHRDEVAFVNLATVEPIGFAPYEENRIAGGFILIDRQSNATVVAGTIRFALRRKHLFPILRSHQVRACAAKRTKTRTAVVYRALSRRKIHYRQQFGAKTPRSRQAHIRARRR